MSVDIVKYDLTPEENLQANEYWDSLMFAPSRVELERARKALGKASLRVQLAVMGHIADLWLQDYKPRKEENPFLITPF